VPTPVQSINGSSIPPSTKLVDSGLTTWTVVGGVVYEQLLGSPNAVPAGFTANVILLLYFNGVIYQENSSFNWFSWSGSAWVATTDPRLVTGLVAAPVSSSQINLSWTALTGALSYNVYENGVLIASLITASTYNRTGLAAGTQYSYTININDAAGLGPQCSPVSATTQGNVAAQAGIAAGSPGSMFGKFVNPATGGQIYPIGVGVLGMETCEGGFNSSGWARDIATASLTSASITSALAAATNSLPAATQGFANFNTLRLNINSAKWMATTGLDPFGNLSGNYFFVGTDSNGKAIYCGGPGGGLGSGPGHETAGNPTNYRTQVKAAITAARNAGLFVFVNMMWGAPILVSTGQYVLPAGQAAFPTDSDLLAWQNIAADPFFSGDHGIVFELMNEAIGSNIYSNMVGTEAAYLGSQSLTHFQFPTATTSPNGTNGGYGMLNNIGSNSFTNILGGGAVCYAVGFQQEINAIRAAGATNLIAVGCTNFTGEVETWSQNGGPMHVTDPQVPSNICASFHAYGYNQGTAKMLAISHSGVPFVCTEMGNLTSATGPNASYTGYLTAGWGYIWWGWPIYEYASNPNGGIQTDYPWTQNGQSAPTGTAPQLANQVPSPAAAVGYTVQTFNSLTVNSTIGGLYPFNYYGETQPAGAYTNSGSNLLIPGTPNANNFNATVCSANINAAKPNGWGGTAFGGGFFAMCTFSMTGTPNGGEPTPSFWFNDIEFQSGSSAYTIVNGHHGELDVIEANASGLASYGVAFHDYSTPGTSSTSYGKFAPPGLNLNQSNTFAALWVPATATTQGYVQFYCNPNNAGWQPFGSVLKWNQYSSSEALPATGSNVGNIMDVRHWFIIIGNSNSATPMTVTSCQVWQASAANNLTA